MIQDLTGAPEQALAWIDGGRKTALATVVETWGSAPRRAGAQMAVAQNGAMQGSVSGGCVEGAVVTEALGALEADEPRLLEYGVSDGDAFAVGLACGGTIRVLVEPISENAMPPAMLRDLVARRSSRNPVVYTVALDGSARALTSEGHGDRLRSDRSGLSEDGKCFHAVHNPPLVLVVVGAVHIAQALVPMARIAGFDPVVVDPREAFASPVRFPETRILHDWPDVAMAEIGVDARTAVVLLTHDPKLDDPALHVALGGDTFYIGALGSRRTHAGRMARLDDAGFSEAQIARVRGPVGLDIGAASPEEIAVSILAQMIEALRRP